MPCLAWWFRATDEVTERKGMEDPLKQKGSVRYERLNLRIDHANLEPTFTKSSIFDDICVNCIIVANLYVVYLLLVN